MKLPNHLLPGLLSLKGVVLPSLSRNFCTALRKPSFDKPKPRLASSISQSAKWFSSALVRTGEGPFRRQSSHSHLACHAELISLVPTFVRLFEYSFHLLSHLSSRLEIFRTVATPFYSHNREICMRILGSTIIASGYSRFTKCSHAKQTKYFASTSAW